MSQKNLSSQQLALYMTPEEIKGRGVDPGEKMDSEHYNWNEDRHETDQELWTRKYHEAHQWDNHGYKKPHDMATDIAIHGVREPVTISKESGRLIDGYHRVAAAAEYRPKSLIPVEYE